MLILVFPSRTCNIFENRSTDVTMPILNAQNEFWIGILHSTVKGDYPWSWKWVFFEHFYLIKRMLSLVSHLYHFILVLSNHNEISRNFIFAGKYLPPFHDIYYRTSLFKNVLTRTFFFICQPIFKLFAAHFATNSCRASEQLPISCPLMLLTFHSTHTAVVDARIGFYRYYHSDTDTKCSILPKQLKNITEKTSSDTRKQTF